MKPSVLIIAIDRATRWVYFRSYPNQSQQSSADFLKKLNVTSPINIKTILTDNGTQFTDRFTSQTNASTGKYPFDQFCDAFTISHRLIPPRHPQTNGTVERFNGRISDILQQTRFLNAKELHTTLAHYLKTYNHVIT